MATIKSQMALNDGMSAVLKKIARALDVTLASFEQVRAASGEAIDTHLIEEGRGLIVESVRDIKQMEDAYRQAAQEEEKLNQNIHQGTSALDGMVAKVASLAGAYMSLSAIKGFAMDSMAAANVQINAQRQLKTVMGNMGSQDYYDQILDKASAIQGKGIYGDEAMIAGAAEFATYFSDGEAILSMMDTLTDYAAGMSGGGALDTEAMVEYATGLGKIMSGSYDAMTKKGFEFSDVQKAIIEGTASEAQIVAELGEEYLGMSQDMQAAAVIGNVIGEGWAGLYETMSNTPEGKLIQLNNALGDIKENVGAGIYPAVLNFVNVIQSYLPQIEAAAMGFATALGFIITLLTDIVSGAMAFGTVVADNWSLISPIVYGVVAALAAYAGYLGITKIMELASAAGKVILIAAEYAHAAATGTAVAATTAETAAQMGLNTALLACPLTWIILLIIALVAGIMALCNWIAKATGVAQSGFGVLCGAINVAIQFIVNLVLAIANFGVAVWNVICEVGQWFQNLGLGIWNVLCACANNIRAAFCNAWIWIQEKFWGFVSAILSGILTIANKINGFIGIFGLEIDTSGIEAQIDALAAKKQELEDSKVEFEDIGEAWSKGWNTNEIDFGQAWSDGMDTFDAFSEGWDADAFAAGAAWGDGVADAVGGFFDGFSYEPGTIEDYADEGMGIDSFTMDDLSDDVGTIADNTGGMADALEVSGEELKYLRDIAERDAINRFTTAEVKVDFSGMTNKIDSSMDLDGVIRELTGGFSEALVTAAEGVHR